MKISVRGIEKFLDRPLSDLKSQIKESNQLLHSGKGVGGDLIGWVNLPTRTSSELIHDIEQTAKRLAQLAEVVVVIGVGGSFLGAEAVINALRSSFYNINPQSDSPIVLFAGQNFSDDYLHELIDATANKTLGLVVISKSGTTLETAVTFNVLRREMERRYGSEYVERIVIITDEKKGVLRKIANDQEFKSFAVEDSVGGRFSVLSPVGLLPLAIAGVDISSIIKGAIKMEQELHPDRSEEFNPAELYAAARVALYGLGKKIEMFVGYEPQLKSLGEWCKQLFGESEGKQGQGIFPTSAVMTTDLHSIGQYIQEGERILFETVISVENSKNSITIKSDSQDAEGINYLADKTLTEINHIACQAASLAHYDSGVPIIRINIERLDEYNLGKLIYFFEKACGISAYAFGVNPFDQPGVEAYKKNMSVMLDDPKHAGLKEMLIQRVAEEF